ncbi:AfsA-related hotdog domain-containing protein [Streptomyces sp. UG1]|uniref:AfsA-related hotdog domain-containing protein n=1 Tax=Streptomyces sp. UG1 TaxID=3417652 RepID=UPI003CF26AD1
MAVLQVDTEHAVFFGHSPDHVPGMLLLEAARQAPPVQKMEADANAGGPYDVQVLGRQGESTVCECEVGPVRG